MRRLRNNKKGLSVIFGVLILIAIAVIAGIIIYMYTSGYLATMLGGGTTGQEKVAIEAVQVISATSIRVSAKSTGGGTVAIQEAILRDSSGNAVGDPVLASISLNADGTMGTVSITVPAMSSGQTYTVALVSKAGNQFVSASFKAP